MKALKSAIFIIALSGAFVAHARLIEDGSSFTGVYQTSQDDCAIEVFDYATGKTQLDHNLSIWGTPDGLSIGTRTRQQPMQKGDVNNAKPNSGATTFEEYVSSLEFRTATAIHFENDGVSADYITSDYLLDGVGGLTVTKTRLHSVTSRDNQVCNYMRIGDTN